MVRQWVCGSLKNCLARSFRRDVIFLLNEQAMKIYYGLLSKVDYIVTDTLKQFQKRE